MAAWTLRYFKHEPPGEWPPDRPFDHSHGFPDPADDDPYLEPPWGWPPEWPSSWNLQSTDSEHFFLPGDCHPAESQDGMTPSADGAGVVAAVPRTTILAPLFSVLSQALVQAAEV